MLVALGSCGTNSNESRGESEARIVVTDFGGRQLNFDKPVGRIVCLIESALSGFYMLGAEGGIVGVSSNVYDDNIFLYYAGLDNRIKNKTLPAPGNWDFVSIENVVSLRPDLVIIWASQTESIKSIEMKGIPVYAVMLKSTDDIYKEIADFGKLTGREPRADSLIRYTKAELRKIMDLQDISLAEKQMVYFMWAQGPLETSGTNSTVNELINFAGAVNACNFPDEHLIVNFERVIDWNPDVIVMWYDANKNPDDIKSIPGWSNLKAVKENSVYELPSVFLTDLWTLKFQYAVKLLAKWAYPEVFLNVDLVKEREEMLQNLYGKTEGSKQ